MVSLKVVLVCALLVAGANSLELLSPLGVISGAKTVVSNTVGDVVGKVANILTGVPLLIAQGVSGTGDWVLGIVDKITEFKDEISIKRRETLLGQYRQAVLDRNPDTTLKFPELCTKYGYPVEEHVVKTDDGYQLKLFRIPFSPQSPPVASVKKPVAFLMHGLVDSSDDWIIMGPGKSLGYILADAGYDVWLGNARGNTYSRSHVALKPELSAFWDFSWDQIGYFDLPAMIDFALAKSGAQNLYYVGHSQGTTSFYVMCSRRPEYNAKIKLMISLAPIAWMSNMVSPMIRLLSPSSKAFGWVLKTLGVGEFLPNTQMLAVAGGIMCKDRAITQDVCTNSLFLVCGFNLDQMNTTMLPVIMGHSPAGSSVGQFLHYGQGVVSKDFRRYDYGMIRNRREYGTLVPPSYDMSKITCPVSLFYSKNDWLSHPTDVMTLSGKLGNMVDLYLVPHPQFNHMDYMWAIDADKLVFNRILDMFKKY